MKHFWLNRIVVVRALAAAAVIGAMSLTAPAVAWSAVQSHPAYVGQPGPPAVGGSDGPGCSHWLFDGRSLPTCSSN